MIGTTISHYKILEKLGAGGMGVVYKAEDARLKRTVALKFLPPDLTRDPEAKQRFIHEAQAASALQHYNICSVHDIDETNDGQLFIVMDCYEGKSLKEKMAGGLMRIEEAADIAIQVAQGLQKAHEKGITHRDVKPGNIIITNDGVVKILDFGLAKLAGQSRLTKTGSTIGTAAYMSPEQAQGLEVDHRTDIWSLGVVLFEMLTGKVPFRGEHEAALLYSVVHEEPQTVTSLRADTQVRVERIIRKLLEKDLAKRYQTMQELIVDLKAAKGPIIDMPRQEKSIVVLPFENLSPDPGNAFFADGLTDELIAELSKIRSLRVISRTSAMLYKEAKKSVPTIAAELNVRHVLEGTVRRVSDNLRITAQLIDASTDTHLWAERYSGTMDDVFDLQERLSRQIAGALKITLTDEDERKLSKRATSDSRAYEAWLRARHELWAFDSGAINRAINLTNEALAVVGDDALLYAALSYFCWAAYDSGVSYSEETLDRAEMFAAKSLELDPEQSQALIALGLAAYKRGGVQAKFIRHAKRAVGVDRNCDALGFLGICLAEAGKMAEARRFADEAVARDPFTFLSLLARVNVDLYGGNIEEALSRLRGWIQKMNQESPLMLWWLGHVAALAGREDEAIEVFDTGARMETGLFSELCALGRGALRDDHNNVFEILATTSLRQVARTDEVYPYFLAMCLTRVGETEEALQWLERAVLWGFTNHRFFSELNRFFKPLRDDARFQRLMDLAREKQRALEV